MFVSSVQVHHRPSRLSLVSRDDGTVRIEGVLSGEDAVVVRGVLEAATDRVVEQYRNDDAELDHVDVRPPRSAALADTLVDLLTRATADEAEPLDLQLVVTCHPDGTLRDDRNRLLARIPPAEGAFGESGDGSNAATRPVSQAETGPVGAGSLLRWLAAASSLTAVHLDDSGAVTTIGHPARFAGPTLVAALAARDGGCVFPGCDEPPAGCLPVHVSHSRGGGATDPENLALLCRHHRRLGQRVGWQLCAHDDQRFIWITHTGRIIHSQRQVSSASLDEGGHNVT